MIYMILMFKTYFIKKILKKKFVENHIVIQESILLLITQYYY